MKLSYLLFALGVVGVALWSAGISASTPDTRDPHRIPVCTYTPIGDIADCD